MLDWTQITPSFLGRDAVIASVLVASLSGLYLRKRSRNALGLPYPPGPEPSPIPFLGNLPDMPSSEGAIPAVHDTVYLTSAAEWHTFTEWGKQYGKSLARYGHNPPEALDRSLGDDQHTGQEDVHHQYSEGSYRPSRSTLLDLQ